MAKQWKADETLLLAAIPTYRGYIEDKDPKESIKLTLEFAASLHQNTPELQHRTVQAIAERLPYLDNLLAGVYETHNYAKKDQHLYALLPRPNKNTSPNLSNTRHSYNGAIRK